MNALLKNAFCQLFKIIRWKQVHSYVYVIHAYAVLGLSENV
uniref:Uncharacterized protein n=1 Tax=Manihot esculenta TaxID=3983 RepID=A0A2C9WNV3_MANES